MLLHAYRKDLLTYLDCKLAFIVFNVEVIGELGMDI